MAKGKGKGKEKEQSPEKKILGTKVIMTETAAGPDYCYTQGREYTLDKKLADAFIRAKAARPVKAVREKAIKQPEENAAVE